MKTLHIKKGDKVIVISGKFKGSKGEVLEVSVKERKVIVSGAKMVKKHVKPRRQGEQGGIVEVEGALVADKVALICNNSECKNFDKNTRSKIKVAEDGTKTRVCAKCGAEL
ncbi:MAG: 50S ribosomal protein L24 [Clostridia bacterium]|nr:50S ribosomal protein L24 [Clostridia bacterium]